jgi:hypothetical protein
MGKPRFFLKSDPVIGSSGTGEEVKFDRQGRPYIPNMHSPDLKVYLHKDAVIEIGLRHP